MKQKITLENLELLVCDRTQEIVEQWCENRKLVEHAVKETISTDFISQYIVSFFLDFHSIRDVARERKNIMVDMQRRAGEPIVERLYFCALHDLEERAREKAEQEFPAFKPMEQRYQTVWMEFKKSKSQNRRTSLAGNYAFTEERLQYDNDVEFLEQVKSDDFKVHTDMLRKHCCGFFNSEDAVDIAIGLLGSGKMKGKNFRIPVSGTVVDAEFDPDAAS